MDTYEQFKAEIQRTLMPKTVFWHLNRGFKEICQAATSPVNTFCKVVDAAVSYHQSLMSFINKKLNEDK